MLPKATLEKFAEISQAEEEQRGGMLLLDGGILPHQRSGGLGHLRPLILMQRGVCLLNELSTGGQWLELKFSNSGTVNGPIGPETRQETEKPTVQSENAMWLVPSKKKWRSWSLPSKLTAIGTYFGLGCGLVSFFIFIISPWVRPAPQLTRLEAKLRLRIDGFQVQVMNEGAVPAKQVTLSLKTWQISAPGPDVMREFDIRDLAPDDDVVVHIEPEHRTGNVTYDAERETRPTCGYIVVRSINSRKPRAWAFFIPGQGQNMAEIFYNQELWPMAEFEYPRQAPQGTQCIDYPEGVCKIIGVKQWIWKP